MKIVADDKIPFLSGALEPYADVIYLPGGKTTAADVKDADALITRTRTKCNQALLNNSSVKFIATATIGYDHFDTAYLDRAGIVWTNAPGCNSSSVAQYLTSVLLNLAVDNALSLRKMTLGVVGIGNVGKKVAAAGRILGMKVLLCDPPRADAEGQGEFVSLDNILRHSDFVTLHVPLTEQGNYATTKMADTGFFAKMKQNAFFINSSRGEVCVNSDLKQALLSRTIRGAVLDVWENEPDLDLELLRLVNYGTPHIAGYSTDGKANGTAMSVNALSKFFNLPLRNWQPPFIPGPVANKITADGAESYEAALLKAVSFTYDIKDDYARLLANPAGFEQQRGDYPLRREFPYFSIAPGKNADDSVLAVLQQLGFKRNGGVQ